MSSARATLAPKLQMQALTSGAINAQLCVWNAEVCPAQDTGKTILLIQSWKLLSLHALFDPLSAYEMMGPVLNTFTLQVDLSENKFFFHI